MKKIYTLFILFCSISFFGQNISFTDTNFKAALLAADTSNSIAKDANLNPIKINSNNDFEISIAEALAVYHLDVSTSNIITNNITNISGISYFINLETLKCNNQQLSSLDISMLSNLKKLVANKNQLTNVLLPINTDPILPNKLEYLSLEKNLLSNLNLTNLPLRYVFLGQNFFNSSSDLNLESFKGHTFQNPNEPTSIISLNNNPNLNFVKLPYIAEFDLNNYGKYYLDIENTNLNLNIFTMLEPTVGMPFGSTKKIISGINILGTPINNEFFNTNSLYYNFELFNTNFATPNSIVFGNKIRNISENVSFYESYLPSSNSNDMNIFLDNYLSQGTYQLNPNLNPNYIINKTPITSSTSANSIYLIGNIQIDGTTINIENAALKASSLHIFDNSSIVNIDVSDYFLNDQFNNTIFPGLPLLYLKNCENLEFIIYKNTGQLSLFNTPNLDFVCVDDAVLAITNFYNATANTSLSSFQYTEGAYCTTYYYGNVLTGNVFYNHNSIDYPINKTIKFTRSNNTNSYYSYSPNYELKAFEDTYTISPLGSFGTNFTIDNTSKTQVVPGYFEPNLTNNFTITKTNTVHDLALTIYQGNPPVQNETFNLIVNVQNLGTELDNCYVDVEYDTSKLTFSSSNPMFSLPYPNTIRITISNSIIPFNSYCYSIPFTVGIPPAVLVGNALVFNAQLTNQSFAADNVVNNSSNTTALVVGSYDPNDKICFEGDTITIDETDEFLTYRVRFQNDGNWFARNIVVTDIIDPKLDMDTFELVGSSHDVKIRSNPDNPRKLEFVFRNINLNWSSQNLAESQGYFIYKIKPNADAVEGSSIENTAAIYFDYNDPIITNTATTVVDSTMGLADNELIKINLLPNPCTNFVQIETEEKIEKVELFDALGRKVLVQLSGNKTINVEQILSGNYFMKVYLGNNKIVTKKIIKQ
jgi:uncharacterized repeat protein (TIGR01451 family)